MSWRDISNIECPLCGELAELIKVHPQEMYDPPYEEFIRCPNCGAFDYEEVKEDEEGID